MKKDKAVQGTDVRIRYDPGVQTEYGRKKKSLPNRSQKILKDTQMYRRPIKGRQNQKSSIL